MYFIFLRKNKILKASSCDEDKEKNNPEEEKKREAEKLLQQRFKTFDVHFKDITNLLDAWDRTQGNIFRQPSPSEKSEHEENTTTIGKGNSKKNPTKGDKGNKEKKDKGDKAETEKKDKAESSVVADTTAEIAAENKEDLTDVQNQSTINLSTEDKRDSKEDTTGVPHIIIEVDDKINHEDICKHTRLPPIEEVRILKEI